MFWRYSERIRSSCGTFRESAHSKVFRFPSTFTFIFRAFASVDGIGKGLAKDFDIPKAAQPFIEGLKPEGAPETDFEVFVREDAVLYVVSDVFLKDL